MAIDTSTSRTRRAILMGALGGVAAAAASVIEHASPTTATDGDVIHVGHSYSSSVSTGITGSGAVAFRGTGEGHTVGLYGKSDESTGVSGASDSAVGVAGISTSSYGIRGSSTYQAGVVGHTDGRAAGVLGYGGSTGILGLATTQYGNGVEGRTTDGYGVYGRSGGIAVYGEATGFGIAIEGEAESGDGVYGFSDKKFGVRGESNENIGVQGQTASSTKPAVQGVSGVNTGVQGSCGSHVPDSPHHTGVFGSAGDVASAVGVKGSSPSGRGGLFAGKLAQLRLVPSADATHPDSGDPGDFFVDGSNRLWYCRGGANWTRLD